MKTEGTRGCFITLEGGEGAGKTTQARHLAQWLEEQGISVLITREPGGSPGAEDIRALLLQDRATPWGRECEALLFCAARADHVRQTLWPALNAGQWVVCDRYVDSHLAYQGYGQGVPLAPLRQLNAFATGGLMPDLTVLLDVPVALGLARVQARAEAATPMDRRADPFHQKVLAGFQALAAEEPARWAVVAAEDADTVVARRIQAVVQQRLIPEQGRG